MAVVSDNFMLFLCCCPLQLPQEQPREDGHPAERRNRGATVSHRAPGQGTEWNGIE